MHFKHAFIAFLLVFVGENTVVFADGRIPEYPMCIPMDIAVEKPTNFLYMVDNLIGEKLLPYLHYLLRSIACDVPDDPRVMNLVLTYSNTQQVPGKAVVRGDITPDFHRNVKDDSGVEFSPCERFKRALGRAPAPFLEMPNVQFMVPIFGVDDEEPNCFVKAFQDQFRDDPRKDNFFFNGILIGSKVTEKANKAIRLVIPVMENSIDLDRPNLHSDEYVGPVMDSSDLVQSYTRLVRSIMAGDNVRDWEESWTPPPLIETTVIPTSSLAPNTSRVERSPEIVNPTTIQNSSTTTTVASEVTLESLETSTSSRNFSTTTENSTNTTTTEAVPWDEFLVQGNDEEAENTTTTVLLDKRAALVVLNVTTVIHNTTVSSKSEVNEYAAHEEPVDGEDLNLAAGAKNGVVDQKSNASDPNGFVDGSDLKKKKNRREIDANLLIYILLLIFVIWLLCILLCLVWMFYCAKKKKNKLEDEADERAKLLTPFLESHGTSQGPVEPKASTESNEDDEEDDWKNIKPAQYTSSSVSNQSKSEMESEKPVESKPQFAPVEVSELENMNGVDEETQRKARRGRVLQPRRTADLRFD